VGENKLQQRAEKDLNGLRKKNGAQNKQFHHSVNSEVVQTYMASSWIRTFWCGGLAGPDRRFMCRTAAALHACCFPATGYNHNHKLSIDNKLCKLHHGGKGLEEAEQEQILQNGYTCLVTLPSIATFTHDQ